jgi:hypothetical protein
VDILISAIFHTIVEIHLSNQDRQNKNEIQERRDRNKDDYSQNTDEVDAFIRSPGNFLRLPQNDGESTIFQFFKDKSKRKLVSRPFIDPITKEVKPQTKIEYVAIDPHDPEQGEKLLDVTKTLALQIEANIAKGHCLQVITRHGMGPSTRYTSIGA